jgi:predicted acyl esterase
MKILVTKDDGIRAWWNYRRPAEYETTVTSVMVPMRDGTTIRGDLSRPSRDGGPVKGRFPGLIVEFTPYASLRPFYNEEASYFVKRGYNALVCDLRGTGGSGGMWQHAFSSQNGRDAHDLIEWLAVQPYSDGRIGQFGESYGGQTSYGAAVERPTHLRAVAPMQTPANLYYDVIYPGGIKSTEGGTMDNWPPMAQVASGGSIDPDAEYAANRAHPTFDDYWQDRTLVGRYDQIEVPVLTIGGWNDEYFRSGTLTNIEGALDRTWVFYGPWTHTFPVIYDDCAPCPPNNCLPGGVVLAWFDKWVMGLPDVPIPEKPTFVSFEGPNGVGAGWRKLPGWYPEGRDITIWSLGVNGTLGQTAGVGPITFHEPSEPEATGGSITFTSEPLATDRVLIGYPMVTFNATLSGPDANFYTELLDVSPDGTETRVNDGFLKASHRISHVTPESVTAGSPTTYRIRIRPKHYCFVNGHRVRLRISGGSSETLVPVASPTDVTVLAGPDATLSLPGFNASETEG